MKKFRFRMIFENFFWNVLCILFIDIFTEISNNDIERKIQTPLLIKSGIKTQLDMIITLKNFTSALS